MLLILENRQKRQSKKRGAIAVSMSLGESDVKGTALFLLPFYINFSSGAVNGHMNRLSLRVVSIPTSRIMIINFFFFFATMCNLGQMSSNCNVISTCFHFHRYRCQFCQLLPIFAAKRTV